jgi:hypothetical protein
MTQRDVSGWLPNLLGPVVVERVGTATPARGALNFIGAIVTDNPTLNRTDIDLSGGLAQEAYDWTPPTAASTDEVARSVDKYFDTVGTTETVAYEFTQADATTVDYTATVGGKSDVAGEDFIADLRAVYKRTAGAFGTVRAPTATAVPDAGNPATWTARFLAVSPDKVQVLVKGAGNVHWNVQADARVLKKVVAGASVPAAPSAISPTSGSTSGGTSVSITVASSTGLTGAKVGGVAVTSFAIVDATHVSGVTGAHSAGAVGVTVSNATGDSPALAAAFTYSAAVFDPATLPLSLWLKPTYAPSTWNSSASTGASGGRAATSAAAPTAATALNSKVGAAFNGTTQFLTPTGLITSDLFSAGAGSMSILYKANSGLAAASANALGDAGLLQDAGAGYFGLGVNATGVSIRVDDNVGGRNLAATATHDGSTWNLVQAKWDGTNLKIRVNSGAWVTGTCGNLGYLASADKIGANYNASVFFPGTIEEIITSATALSDANSDNIKSYVNATYGLSL